MSIIPLRSVLYMPGSNERAMEKARQLPADAIILDLEDAVAPSAKVTARSQVLEQLHRGGFGQRRLVVRCNALTSPWGEADIRAFADSPATTLCLPKIESAADLAAVQDLLHRQQWPRMALWPMIETPLGVANAREIAAHQAVTALVMGTTDLTSELRVPTRPDRLGLLYALGECVLAARLSRVAVLDGVCLDIKNGAEFAASCEQGRALGFDGKTLIHPSQIADANRIFGPSPAAVSWAERLLQAWEEAERAGAGIAVLDGKLVETMHVDEARRTLALAAHIDSLQAPESHP